MEKETIDRAYMDLRIREVMQRQGVTGIELAARLGKHSQYIYNVINGGPQASIGALISIAKALGVPFRDLFGPGTNNEELGVRAFSPKNAEELSSDTPLQARCPHCGKPINILLTPHS